MDLDADPPRGFQIATGDGGECVIRYRTTGMGCLALTFAVWLTAWTTGCIALTNAALFQAEGVHWLGVLFMVPFWIAEFFVLAFVAWLFWSVTTFTFQADELIVERTLGWYRRRRVFPRQGMTSVKQVQDGGKGEDSFPSWALVIGAGVGPGVAVLSRQPLDKANWLGPVIARWAGVSYVPCEPPPQRL